MALVKSERFSLNAYDIRKWLYNTCIFLVPVALVLLAEIVKVIPVDWKYGVYVLYGLNVITDLIKKWASENTYQK